MFTIWKANMASLFSVFQNSLRKKMRDLMSGNGRAKLAAMWEGPFEFYVWLDSDAIVWGDFSPQVRTDVDFQIFWSDIDLPADAPRNSTVAAPFSI